MFSWLAWAITLIVGPVVFLVFSRVLYRHASLGSYPIGLVDSVGDGIALPIFNGLAFGFGLPFSALRFALACIASLFVTFVFYRTTVRSPLNWSKHDDSSLNAGGWWHLAFFFVEGGIVAYALLTYPASLALWIAIVAYLLTSAYYFFVQLPRRSGANT